MQTVVLPKQGLHFADDFGHVICRINFPKIYVKRVDIIFAKVYDFTTVIKTDRVIEVNHLKLSRTEDRMITGIHANLWLLALGAAVVLGVVMRMSGWDYISRDAEVFLLPWFDKIKELGGFAALRQQVGNYNIPYQTLIALMTYLPVDPLSQYKLLSVVFDFVLAAGAAALTHVCCRAGKNAKAAVAFILVLCLPTVVFNSSVWAQCDSIFTAFAVWALYFMKKQRYSAAFWFYGLSFAFKLQAVFLLPVFVVLYFAKRSFSALHFLQIPAASILLSLPAVFAGRPLVDVFLIYFRQTDTYENMFLNYPSLYAAIGDDYATLKTFAVCLCFVALLLALLFYMNRRHTLAGSGFLELCVWSVWCCVLLLPAMHERYAFAADVLSVLLALQNKKYIWASVFINLSSVIVYGAYLFGYQAIGLPTLAVLNIAAFAYFSYCIFYKYAASAPLAEVPETGSETNE